MTRLILWLDMLVDGLELVIVAVFCERASTHERKRTNPRQ